MFLFQHTHEYFVQVAHGLEELAAKEIVALGALHVQPAYRGLYIQAEDATVMRICYESRLASRVLALLSRFSIHTEKDVYRHALDIPWHKLFSKNRTFAVTFHVANSVFKNGQYAALLLKDAICDRFRQEFGTRPNVDTNNPHVTFHVFVHGDKGQLSVDYAGTSLHKRGYRTHNHGLAPMQETLAAAILYHTGFDGTRPLWDPMCGSGTLAAEALMKAAHIPAGYLRKYFGFFALETFDAATWKRVKHHADAAISPLFPGRITASDIDAAAVEKARANLAHLPFHPVVQFKTADFVNMPEFHDGIIVCNPPYGIRMGDTASVTKLYTKLGDFLKKHCKGSTAWVYLGNPSLVSAFHLKPACKIPMPAGDLDGRLVCFNLF